MTDGNDDDDDEDDDDEDDEDDSTDAGAAASADPMKPASGTLTVAPSESVAIDTTVSGAVILGVDNMRFRTFSDSRCAFDSMSRCHVATFWAYASTRACSANSSAIQSLAQCDGRCGDSEAEEEEEAVTDLADFCERACGFCGRLGADAKISAAR